MLSEFPNLFDLRLRESVAWSLLSFNRNNLSGVIRQCRHLPVGQCYWIHANEMRADSNRVFELRIYHAVPGKGPALESVFRDASKVMANHGINVIGYWVPNEDPAWKDTFIYIVAHSSREQAKRNWDALHADPAFRPYVEAAKPLIDKAGKVFRVDEVYMRPTDFSPMR